MNIRDNINNHKTLLIHSYYIILERQKQYWITKITFGLIEGKNTSMTQKQISVSVNSTGVLFIYL
jgi:hypothetical protein